MTGKEKELFKLGDQAMCLANDKFGVSGWSHSVTHQSIDFIDSDDRTYEVGVSALVKVTLKDGCFHEHVGFGVTKGQSNKGLCIAKARKLAANDALLNALRAFGTEFQNLVPSGKITDYLSPSQKVTKHSQASASSVKRKLKLNGDNSNDSSDLLMQSVTEDPFSSPETYLSNQSQKRFAASGTNLGSFRFCEPRELTISRVPLSHTQSKNMLSNAQAGSSHQGNADCIIVENPNCTSYDAVLQAWSTTNIQSKESPFDENKRKRKIRQLQLEIEARETLKNELMKEKDNDESIMKNEKHNDFHS